MSVVLVLVIVGGLGVMTWPKWKIYVEGLVTAGSSMLARDSAAPEAEPAGPAGPAAEESTPDEKPAPGPATAQAEPPATDPAPQSAAARTAERLSSVAARLDLLAERIGRLEAKAARPPAVDAALLERIDGISESLSGLDRRVAAAETATATVREEGRNRRADALVLAVGNLREALSRGAPFAQELAGLKSVAGGNRDVRRAVTTITARAAGGIPTLADLRARFPRVAAASARAAIAPENGGWMDRTVARMSSVVTVRRTGADVRGDTPDAIVARGEAALERGDLPGATRHLGDLKGAPAAAMGKWLADARARVAADAAMGALTRIAIARIAAAQKAGGG